MTGARTAGVTGAAVRRVTHGATAVFGGRRSLRPSPYLVFGTLFWVVAGAAAWRVPVCCDFGHHAAVVERLVADLSSPAHPTAALPGTGSPYYSPYTVLQGALARLTGLDGRQTVRLSGPVNLLVLLTGLGRFVRVLTPRQWAPVLALGFLLLLHGTGAVWRSGSPELTALTVQLSFPSTFAVGLTFWVWAVAGRLASSGGRLPSYLLLGVLGAAAVLVHPAGAPGTLAGVAALVAGWQRGRHARVVGRWAAAAAVAVLLAAAWPYFSVFSVFSTPTGMPETPGTPSVAAAGAGGFGGPAAHSWLALVGLPALWLRLRRDRRDPLVLMFALDLLIAGFGYLTGHGAYGRILDVAPIPLQCALAVELAGPRPWLWPRRLLAGAAAAAALTGFLCAQAGAVVPRALDPVGFAQPPREPSYAWAAAPIGPGEVVLTDSRRAARALPGYGAVLVAPALPDAALPDTALPEWERSRRLAAVDRYLDPGSTRAERDRIVRRYDVRWLLLPPERRAPAEAVVAAWSPHTGEVLLRVPGSGHPGGAPSGAVRSGPAHPMTASRPVNDEAGNSS